MGPESIRSANYRIKKNILTTPLTHSAEYSVLCGCQMYLKLDNLQKTGSFKVPSSKNEPRYSRQLTDSELSVT